MGNDEPLLTTGALLIREREEAAAKERAKTAEPDTHTLESLLASAGLDDHCESLSTKSSLDELLSRLRVNRPLFLEYVRELGLSKLNDRQKLANALAKADRTGQLPVPTLALPHLKPCTFEEDDAAVTVRLSVPSATSTNQLKITLDAASLKVDYCGGPTAAHGKLGGQIVTADAFWEVERAARPEYDPLLEAHEQPPPPDDTLVISLPKRSGSARWRNLFTDAVAHRAVPPAAEEDETARTEKAARAEWEKVTDLRKKEMLYGVWPLTPMPPKPEAIRRLEEKERVARERRMDRRREAESRAHGTEMTHTAKEHWQPAKAVYVWRDGLASVRGVPDGPDGCPPLFSWSEDREVMVVRARTAAGRSADELKLEIGTNFVDCFVGGRPTPWCGVLCGKVDPTKCTLTVIEGDAVMRAEEAADAAGEAKGTAAAGSEDEMSAAGRSVAGVCDTLVLTLHKAAASQLWRAPWPELLPPLDKRDAKLVQQGQVPRRDWLTAGVGGGYDEMQTSEAWTVLFPIRAGNPNFSHDQLRVGVTADSVNLHIAGQEESPLLGGETYGRILPASCTWRVLPAEQVDGLLVEKIELRLVKEVAGGGMWRALFKGQYT